MTCLRLRFSTRCIRDLETLATLAGFTAHLVLAWRLQPDVLRACAHDSSVFLGDAKDTETPGCEATRRRLRWYF